MVESYHVNVTQLHTFDEVGVVKKVDNLREKESEAPSTPSLFGLSMAYTVKKNATSFTITDLKPITMYELQVTAINRNGKSLPSSTVRVVTLSKADEQAELSTINPDTHLTPQLPDFKKCCMNVCIIIIAPRQFDIARKAS